MRAENSEKVSVVVIDRGGTTHVLTVDFGTKLRDALLIHHLSPYQGSRINLNCKGLGICGTCKVVVREDTEYWERRSCQIQCFQDLEIRLK